LFLAPEELFLASEKFFLVMEELVLAPNELVLGPEELCLAPEEGPPDRLVQRLFFGGYTNVSLKLDPASRKKGAWPSRPYRD
jgi:hypothetical protein